MADQPVPSRGARGATGKTGARGRTGKQAVTPDAYLKKADELQVSLDGVREELRVANQRSIDAEDAAADANKTAKRSKRASRLALVAAVLALAGLFGVWRTAEARASDRRASQVGSCHQDNATVRRSIKTTEAKARDLIEQADKAAKRKGEPPTPKADADGYIASQIAAAERENPYRDCTLEGIKLWIKNHPDADPKDCVSDGKGFCK